jgi:hypothetical protein
MNSPLGFAPWQNFFYIVGSSSAALIGVQFVVITLIATIRRRADAATISAFATPTVVHLGAALIVSAFMSVPWQSIAPLSVALAACGVAGFAYCIVVIRRARHQTGYEPVWEDWLWYAALPCSAYALLAVGAVLLCNTVRIALFTVGGAVLALLFIGIHNAWDAVTHMVTARTDGDRTGSGTQGDP